MRVNSDSVRTNVDACGADIGADECGHTNASVVRMNADGADGVRMNAEVADVVRTSRGGMRRV